MEERIEGPKDFEAFKKLYGELLSKYSRLGVFDQDFDFFYISDVSPLKNFQDNFMYRDYILIPKRGMDHAIDHLVRMETAYNKLNKSRV